MKVEERDPNDMTRSGLYFLDYGNITCRKIIRSIKNCKKLLWLDLISPNSNEFLNDSNNLIAKCLVELQENKRLIIQRDLNNDCHDYKNDLIVFTFGKELEKMIEILELVEPTSNKMPKEGDEVK